MKVKYGNNVEVTPVTPEPKLGRIQDMPINTFAYAIDEDGKRCWTVFKNKSSDLVFLEDLDVMEQHGLRYDHSTFKFEPIPAGTIVRPEYKAK